MGRWRIVLAVLVVPPLGCALGGFLLGALMAFYNNVVLREWLGENVPHAPWEWWMWFGATGFGSVGLSQGS